MLLTPPVVIIGYICILGGEEARDVDESAQERSNGAYEG